MSLTETLDWVADGGWWPMSADSRWTVFVLLEDAGS